MKPNASNCVPSKPTGGASGILMGCDSFLKKGVAVVVFVVANIFLNIPRYLLMGLAAPFMIGVHPSLKVLTSGASIVPIDSSRFFEDGCFGLFAVMALPYIALLITSIDDKIEWVAEKYPVQLWNGTWS